MGHAIWLLPDTHFNHKGMLHLCGRPHDYEKRIDHAVKTAVQDSDTLVHLGDICLGGDQEVHDRYIKQWPGKKILIRGNHDKQSVTWYFRIGWDCVCDYFGLEYFGKKVLLSHRPMDLGEAEVNIHGHFHNSGHRRGEQDGVPRTGDHVLLALEWMNYHPIQLRTVIEKGAPRGKVTNLEVE